MIASHYVFEEILESFDDVDALKANFKKFAQRYPSDPELAAAYTKFKAIKNRDKKSLLPLKEEIGEIMAMRARESGGGSSLPFKDRRHLK